MPAPRPRAVTSATAPPAVEAVRSIARLARLFERASGGLGLAHYRVLSAVAAGEQRAARVAERLELGRPTISAAVESLSRAGLLERVAMASDQRGFELRLTAAGRTVLAAVETEMVDVLEELCEHLPAPRRAVDALASLGVALDARAARRHLGPR